MADILELKPKSLEEETQWSCSCGSEHFTLDVRMNMVCGECLRPDKRFALMGRD